MTNKVGIYFSRSNVCKFRIIKILVNEVRSVKYKYKKLVQFDLRCCMVGGILRGIGQIHLFPKAVVFDKFPFGLFVTLFS